MEAKICLSEKFYCGGIDITAKQVDAFNRVFSTLPYNCRESFQDIAEYAMSLGYMPTAKGVRKDYLDFSNSNIEKNNS